jgi:hypothetical protein
MGPHVGVGLALIVARTVRQIVMRAGMQPADIDRPPGHEGEKYDEPRDTAKRAVPGTVAETTEGGSGREIPV